MSLVLGLGLEHSCPWPRKCLSSERLSLVLASDFFCVLGLELCVLDSTSDNYCRSKNENCQGHRVIHQVKGIDVTYTRPRSNCAKKSSLLFFSYPCSGCCYLIPGDVSARFALFCVLLVRMGVRNSLGSHVFHSGCRHLVSDQPRQKGIV